MKNALISICAVSAAMCWGAPTLTIDFVGQNPDSRLVTIEYTVGNEPAVVTLDSIVADGVPLDESRLADVQGDVNKLIPIGPGRIYWKPDETAKGTNYTAASFQVTAWATNAPPDYMVIDLLNKGAERVYYYTSTNRFPVPLSDASYRTTKLVMRRIPAAGVTFRMGSPTDETGRQTSTNYEATHYVSFKDDFYLGIYPVTRRQHNLLTGKNSPNYFANYGEGLDWPVTGIQLCALRTWLVEAGAAATHKYWPRDGHELDYDSGHENNGNHLYFMRQRFPGFMFDLPTEAQWEFACRGGATEYEARYGDVDEVAWTSSNSLSSDHGVYLPHPVGQLKPNGYGLYDMLGNVWEKMLDAWETMPNDTTVRTDPTGPDLGIVRDTKYVIRGGAFSCDPKYARAANRSHSTINALLEGSMRVSTGNATVNGSATGNNYSFGYRLWLPAHAVK